MLQHSNGFFRHLILILITGSTVACAVLHKVQLAEVDGDNLSKGEKISIRVSETTVNVREAAEIAKLTQIKEAGAFAKVAGYYSMLFTFGPSTGTPVFNEFYARNIPEALKQRCQKGQLSNIISVRETREYPVIKGEIVRVDAVCVDNIKRKK